MTSRSVPIHPLLFSVFPVVSLLANNISQTSPAAAVRSLLVVVLVGSALWALVTFASGDVGRAGLSVSLTMLLIFSFGHVQRLLADLLPGTASDAIQTPLLAIFFIVLLAGLALIWLRLQHVSRAGQAANLVGAVLLVAPLLSLGSYYLAVTKPSGWAPDPVSLSAPVESASRSTVPPDIYYIVLDGYGRQDVLENLYQIDNSQLLDFLVDRGFFIADASRTNYVGTLHSLASSLNMDYVNAQLDGIQAEPARLQLLSDMIRVNRVMASLENMDYRLVSVSSGYGETDLRNADVYLASSFRGLNGFESLLIRQSAFGWYLAKPNPILPEGMAYAPRRERIQFAFDQLGTLIPDLEGPKFVFVHIVAPHPPFVFGSQGEHLQPDFAYTLMDGSHFPGTLNEYMEGYTRQLAYIDMQVADAVEKILTASEETPIILIQSDHGPGAYLDWSGVERNNCLIERVANFMALLIPAAEGQIGYHTITPVNLFRQVFDTNFGTSLGFLPDRSYFASPGDSGSFTDVTEVVEQAAACSIRPET